MRVTCPEKAHLETLEVEHHPLGILITGCSGWADGGEETCTRRCASLLDRRDRRARSRLSPDEVGDETRLDLDLDDLDDLDVAVAPRPGS